MFEIRSQGTFGGDHSLSLSNESPNRVVIDFHRNNFVPVLENVKNFLRGMLSWGVILVDL